MEALNLAILDRFRAYCQCLDLCLHLPKSSLIHPIILRLYRLSLSARLLVFLIELLVKAGYLRVALRWVDFYFLQV